MNGEGTVAKLGALRGSCSWNCSLDRPTCTAIAMHLGVVLDQNKVCRRQHHDLPDFLPRAQHRLLLHPCPGTPLCTCYNLSFLRCNAANGMPCQAAVSLDVKRGASVIIALYTAVVNVNLAAKFASLMMTHFFAPRSSKHRFEVRHGLQFAEEYGR